MNRLMNIITLLDCAFAFFANFPCRLTVSEMRFDLPCEEGIFSSSHPFAEPKFAPSRHLTTFEAFQSLFGQLKSTTVPNHGKKGNPLGLNPMDMFILVHCKSCQSGGRSYANYQSTLRLRPHPRNTFLLLSSSNTRRLRNVYPDRSTRFLI